MRVSSLCAVAVALIATLILGSGHARAERDKVLTFGMSAAFTGANNELGIEFYRGLMAAVEDFNSQGGANGWRIAINPLNDGYNPRPCFQNTTRFITEDNVFAMTSYVGTPTTTHILPLLQKFDSRDMYLLFPFTGAQPLREAPFNKYVYNLRASYFDETAGLVDNFVSVGRTRIAVFYQSDAYGRTGWDGVRRALRGHGLNIVSEAAYRRGASFHQDFSKVAKGLMKKGPDAIIVIGTYASQGAFIRDARDAGYEEPIAGLSFSDSGKMLNLLIEEGKRSGKDYTVNLIHSQVVPSYNDLSLEGVRRYRKIMDAYKGRPVNGEMEHVGRPFSYVSFEGFLNGQLLTEMVRRMADRPSRDRIPEVMRSIRDYDLGIGEKVNFDNPEHQGLNAVYFTTPIDGHFHTFESWERWRK